MGTMFLGRYKTLADDWVHAIWHGKKFWKRMHYELKRGRKSSQKKGSPNVRILSAREKLQTRPQARLTNTFSLRHRDNEEWKETLKQRACLIMNGPLGSGTFRIE